MVSSSLGVAGAGLLFFILARIGFQGNDPVHFGSWRQAPSWARIAFGSVGESVSPYNLAAEVWGLTWGVGGLAFFATGDPPGPPLRQILAALMLVALVGCVVCWVVVFAGRVLRDSRKR
jgi:hypothetical protein